MKVKTETIIRTAVLALALLNQVLVICGKTPLPVKDEELTQVLSLCLTIGASVWSWWKNASFTSSAIAADKVLNKIKHGDITTNDVAFFIGDEYEK